MTGRVKWWSDKEGYGFIEYNDYSNSFVHIKKEQNINSENNIVLKDGQTIEFEITEENNIKYIFNLKKLI